MDNVIDILPKPNSYKPKTRFIPLWDLSESKSKLYKSFLGSKHKYDYHERTWKVPKLEDFLKGW